MRWNTPVLCLIFLFSVGASPAVELDARDATVIIEGQILTPQGLRAEIGAGVIIGQNDGLEIATAYHVAAHDPLQVTTWDGEVLNVTEVMHVPGQDLAIIKTPIPDRMFPSIKTALPDTPGSPMFTYGAPGNQRWKMSEGQIRDKMLLPPQLVNGEFAMTCSTCANGSSGGGIFNAQGGLEGILIATFTAADGVHTFVAEPVTKVPELLAKL